MERDTPVKELTLLHHVFTETEPYYGHGLLCSLEEYGGRVMAIILPLHGFRITGIDQEFYGKITLPADILEDAEGPSCSRCMLNWTDELLTLAGKLCTPLHEGSGVMLSLCPKCHSRWGIKSTKGRGPKFRTATERDITFL